MSEELGLKPTRYYSVTHVVEVPFQEHKDWSEWTDEDMYLSYLFYTRKTPCIEHYTGCRSITEEEFDKLKYSCFDEFGGI